MAYELESFVNNLEQNQYFRYLNAKLQNRFQTLHAKASFLRDLARRKSFPDVIPEKLEIKIRNVVHKAEDTIDIYFANKILSGDEYSESDKFDLEFLIEEFDSIKAEMMMLKNVDEQGCDMQDDLLDIDISVLSNRWNFAGFSQHHTAIMPLIRESPKLQIISIVGAGGMGKTLMAEEFFYRVLEKHFNARVWLSVSREYNVRGTLFKFLAYLRELGEEMLMLKDDQLGEIVYGMLKGKKYLIVMDDIFNSNNWDQIRRFFPDEDNGSRIILTTRSLSLANHASSSQYIYRMSPMDLETSWKLLTREVYGDMLCPPKFEDIAHYFAQACQGSPLAIRILGGLLRRYRSKVDLLNLILNAFTKEAATRADINEVVLSLSYRHLPISAKPCFLYLGAFPRNYKIQPFNITQLWIAEGFLNMHESENQAKTFFYHLARQNLLVVSLYGSSNVETCFTMNNIVRDFCLKKSREEKFLWYKSLDDSNILGENERMRRVSAHPPSPPGPEREQLPLTRSFLSIYRISSKLAPAFLRMKLLRILNVYQMEFYQFPKDILQMVLLKFLALSCHSPLPSSISRLKNLQTLIMRRLPWFSYRAFVIPSELWEMAQLRHLKSKESCVIYSPNNTSYVQTTLQTLSIVQTIGVTSEFFAKVPNLRNLGLFCNSSINTVIDITCLRELQILRCCSDWSFASHNFLSSLKFPSSLIKLSLIFCKIPGGLMSIIGSLPKLKELKVKRSDFPLNIELGMPREPVWECRRGEFPELLKLQIESLNLVTWTVNENSFLKLKHLIIRKCTLMEALPSAIERIPNIQIEMHNSIPSIHVADV